MSEAQPDTAMADADVSDHDRILQRGQPSKVGTRARIRRWADAPPLTGNDARFAFLYGAQDRARIFDQTIWSLCCKGSQVIHGRSVYERLENA